MRYSHSFGLARTHSERGEPVTRFRLSSMSTLFSLFAEPASHAFKRCTTAALCALAIPAAYAARPLNTDDARVVDVKSCQVESWTRIEQSRKEYWALPGCNFGGDVEFTLGGGHFRDEGQTASDLLAQAKVLVKPLTTNGWGAAITGGAIRHRPLGGEASSTDVYVNVPLSFSLADDRYVLHTNTGWLHDAANKRHVATWGVGGETQLNEHVGVIAEAFGQVSRDSFYQVGLRFWIVPNRVQIDTTYGNRIGAAVGAAQGTQARWFSIGLRLLSPAFLP
jgi:hypothetical protein